MKFEHRFLAPPLGTLLTRGTCQLAIPQKAHRDPQKLSDKGAIGAKSFA